MIKENERITYEEFMVMFKFAPRMCYTLYDRAENEIEQYKSDYEKEKYLVDKLTRQLTDEYKNTEKQKERGDHYKKLYSEIKKQKNYVFEYITSEESINTFTTIESREQWLKINKKLLRMLGEIDVKD